MTSLGRHSAKGLSKTFDDSIVALVNDYYVIGVENAMMADNL